MAYPQGFLFPPPASSAASVSLALSSCPSVLLGPRAGHEGSAFAPYSASSANPHAPYGGEPRAAAAISSFLSPGYDPSPGLEYHPFGPLGPFPYGDPAYRKNATRDATATLKAWLNEHRKNPYPTKGEKIMLAIITKMTLTQVSTWFANARRRLKKENKMTWTPRNRSEDEEEEDLDPERPDEEEQDGPRGERSQGSERADTHPASVAPACSLLYTSDPASADCTPHCSPGPQQQQQRPPLVPRPSSSPPPPLVLHPISSSTPPTAAPSPDLAPTPTPPKPKLWSLAEIATSSDKKLSNEGDPPACPRTPLHARPLYYSPPFIYNSYSTLGPGLSLNGLQPFSRADRDFRLRAFGHERDDLKKGTTSA